MATEHPVSLTRTHGNTRSPIQTQVPLSSRDPLKARLCLGPSTDNTAPLPSTSSPQTASRRRSPSAGRCAGRACDTQRAAASGEDGRAASLGREVQTRHSHASSCSGLRPPRCTLRGDVAGRRGVSAQFRPSSALTPCARREGCAPAAATGHGLRTWVSSLRLRHRTCMWAQEEKTKSAWSPPAPG